MLPYSTKQKFWAAYRDVTETQSRSDERAYAILRHIQVYAEALYMRGQITADVQRAIQRDVISAHLAIDVQQIGASHPKWRWLVKKWASCQGATAESPAQGRTQGGTL